MSTINIGGWVVGNVDTQASVEETKAEYEKSPSQETLAAYNAAVANAYAAETALTPLAGAYFAEKAVTADLLDIKLNGPTQSKYLTLIGNYLVMSGQIVQMLALRASVSTPFLRGVSLRAFALGELIDGLGLAITAAGVVADSPTIINYFREFMSTLGLTPVTGAGMVIPGKTPISDASYTLTNMGDGTFSLLYNNSVFAPTEY